MTKVSIKPFFVCSVVVEPVGALMAYRNTPVINWVSQGQAIKYKDVLTTYIRTMTPISSLGKAEF